jgi:hypothetical protein
MGSPTSASTVNGNSPTVGLPGATFFSAGSTNFHK